MSSERTAKQRAQADGQPMLAKQKAVWQPTPHSTDQVGSILALRDFGAVLLQATTLDAVLKVVEEQLGSVLPHDGGFLLIRSTHTRFLQQHLLGALMLPRIDDERLQVTGGLVAQVYADGHARSVHGVSDSRLAFWERHIIGEDQSLVCVPLIIAQRCDGVLAIRGPVGTRFNDATCALLMVLAAPLSLAIERTQQHMIMAQQAQAIKTVGMRRLTSAIGHELRNPLQGLQGSLQLLLNVSLLAPKRELVLQKARDEVERLVTTVQRMLECYTPAYEDMRPIAVPVLLERVLTLVAPQIREHAIVVERDWEAGLPYVRGIEGHLKQALLTVLLNAIEAMPAGGHMSIRAHTAERPADQMQIIEIQVTDSGSGIAPEHMSALFEPFYSTKPNQAGLGLAISYGIIEHHSGSLRVSSDSTGSTFSITLPTY